MSKRKGGGVVKGVSNNVKKIAGLVKRYIPNRQWSHYSTMPWNSYSTINSTMPWNSFSTFNSTMPSCYSIFYSTMLEWQTNSLW